MTKSTISFRYFYSSPEVIRLVVMMYVKYPLSLRNVEDLLAERGIDICHETVRLWWNRFGPMFAAEIRRKRIDHMRAYTHWALAPGRCLREVQRRDALPLAGRRSRRRGPGILCHRTRDKVAALKFIKKAMKRHSRAKAIVTDGLRSYRAALKELGNTEKQEVGRWANNRAENSHLPFRRRERAMLRFPQVKTLQKFSSVHAAFHNHFNQDRHLISRDDYKARRSAALAEWQTLAG